MTESIERRTDKAEAGYTNCVLCDDMMTHLVSFVRADGMAAEIRLCDKCAEGLARHYQEA